MTIEFGPIQHKKGSQRFLYERGIWPEVSFEMFFDTPTYEHRTVPMLWYGVPRWLITRLIGTRSGDWLITDVGFSDRGCGHGVWRIEVTYSRRVDESGREGWKIFLREGYYKTGLWYRFRLWAQRVLFPTGETEREQWS